jgi:hypothetical protein
MNCETAHSSRGDFGDLAEKEVPHQLNEPSACLCVGIYAQLSGILRVSLNGC